MDYNHKNVYLERINAMNIAKKSTRAFTKEKVDLYLNNIGNYKRKNYSIKDGNLYFKDKKVVTIEESFDLIQPVHLNYAHANDRYMLPLLQKDYYGIVREMLRAYTNTCIGCQETKKVVNEQPVKPIISNLPRERILLDLINMNQFNKDFKNMKKEDIYHYILTIIDHYSNFTMVYAQKTKSEKETTRNVANYIRIFGAPKIMQMDNGLEFVNDVIKQLFKSYHIKEIHSAPYRPQTNGKVENYNGFIKRTMRKFMYPKPEIDQKKVMKEKKSLNERNEKKVYWIDYVDRIIERINTGICRRTHCKPRSLFLMDIQELMKENKELQVDMSNAAEGDCNDDIDENEIYSVVVSDNDNESEEDDDEEDYGNESKDNEEEAKEEDDDNSRDGSDSDDEDNVVLELNKLYRKKLEKDIIKNKDVIMEVNKNIHERRNKYNNKMHEDSKKKIKNKAENIEHGDVVVVAEKRRNHPDVNKLAIVKEDRETKKKYAMYKIFLLLLNL